MAWDTKKLDELAEEWGNCVAAGFREAAAIGTEEAATAAYTRGYWLKRLEECRGN